MRWSITILREVQVDLHVTSTATELIIEDEFCGVRIHSLHLQIDLVGLAERQLEVFTPDMTNDHFGGSMGSLGTRRPIQRQGEFFRFHFIDLQIDRWTDDTRQETISLDIG